jgi:hypothetical protein
MYIMRILYIFFRPSSISLIFLLISLCEPKTHKGWAKKNVQYVQHVRFILVYSSLSSSN